MTQVRSPRPPLAYLDGLAQEMPDSGALAQRLEDHLPLKAFLQAGSASAFFHRSGVLSLGSVTVSCSDHSPLEVAFDDGHWATLVLPCQGSAQVHLDGHRFQLQAGPMAAYLPGCAFAASTGMFQEVMITLERRRLAETAATLQGHGRSAASFLQRIETPLLIEATGRTPQAELLAHLNLAVRMAEAPLLQSVGGFGASRLEDLLYRLGAALICPELVPLAEGSGGPGSPVAAHGRDRLFEELLEWIEANLRTPITPTALSRHSSYSMRSLQYLFQRRCGCSPMQWVKQRRLNAVYNALHRSQPGETVAAIARRYGFVQLSCFAASFRQSYGLAPSELLRRGRAQR